LEAFGNAIAEEAIKREERLESPNVESLFKLSHQAKSGEFIVSSYKNLKRERERNSTAINRIPGTVIYIRPLRLQASLRAHDLARYRKLLGVGHCFGKVSVLAIIPSKIYLGELEWTSNADRLKLNGRFANPNKSFIGPAIVAVVRRKLGNFRET